MKRFIYIVCLLTVLAPLTRAQLVIAPSTNPVTLVNNFILFGVTASNVVYTGGPNSLGEFSNGLTTNLGMNDGIVFTTGLINGTPAIGSPCANFVSNMNNNPGDSLLNLLIPGYTTNDASILEFDLVPVGNILEFNYVFASEEYPEFVNSAFNDVFGFFISGANPAGGNYVNQNIAIIPGTSLPVAIDNVNAGLNSAYYVDNQTLGGQTIVFDGFTTVLNAQITVIPSSTYHLKMAIADAGDYIYDSGIFLKAQSMKSYVITGMDEKPTPASRIYPNPMNSNSSLSISIQQAGSVKVGISDYSGKQIYSTGNHYDQPGSYSFDIGSIMRDYPSGIYFISIQTPDGSSMQKIIK